jgi:hypothetical protein
LEHLEQNQEEETEEIENGEEIPEPAVEVSQEAPIDSKPDAEGAVTSEAKVNNDTGFGIVTYGGKQRKVTYDQAKDIYNAIVSGAQIDKLGNEYIGVSGNGIEHMRFELSKWTGPEIIAEINALDVTGLEEDPYFKDLGLGEGKKDDKYLDDSPEALKSLYEQLATAEKTKNAKQIEEIKAKIAKIKK